VKITPELTLLARNSCVNEDGRRLSLSPSTRRWKNHLAKVAFYSENPAAQRGLTFHAVDEYWQHLLVNEHNTGKVVLAVIKDGNCFFRGWVHADEAKIGPADFTNPGKDKAWKVSFKSLRKMEDLVAGQVRSPLGLVPDRQSLESPQ